MRLNSVWSAASIVCLAAAGCGGGSPSATAPSGSTAGVVITIVGQNGTQAFSPNPSPSGGQAVAFRNNDRERHHIVLNDGSIDLGEVAPGATSRGAIMPSAGTHYHCTIHPGMIGSIGASSGAPAPPCQGSYCDGY